MRLFQVPIAHRGLHDGQSPENSPSAFQKAIDAGYNIETDVHLLKDGKVVCFHDFTLQRVLQGKQGKIEDLTYADLCGNDYLLPNGEHIPLFEDLIALVDGKVNILCELKSINAIKFDLEKKVYELIKDKPWIKVQAFNPISMIWFARNAPEVCRGQLATDAPNKLLKILFMFTGPFKLLKKSRPDFFAYNIECLPNPKVTEACKKYGMKLLSWTVDTEEKVATAHKANVDNIIFEAIRPEGYKK
ncbi:MAG: glycerophosphodiester phosphodiesterase family protein [Clostridia bacterium]|nr:glycerophosphodiester phosphodiesterase family protein [Clostridia bacterium]